MSGSFEDFLADRLAHQQSLEMQRAESIRRERLVLSEAFNHAFDVSSQLRKHLPRNKLVNIEAPRIAIEIHSLGRSRKHPSAYATFVHEYETLKNRGWILNHEMALAESGELWLAQTIDYSVDTAAFKDSLRLPRDTTVSQTFRNGPYTEYRPEYRRWVPLRPDRWKSEDFRGTDRDSTYLIPIYAPIDNLGQWVKEGFCSNHRAPLAAYSGTDGGRFGWYSRRLGEDPYDSISSFEKALYGWAALLID